MLIEALNQLLKTIVSSYNIRGTSLVHIVSYLLQNSILMLLNIKREIQSWPTIACYLNHHHEQIWAIHNLFDSFINYLVQRLYGKALSLSIIVRRKHLAIIFYQGSLSTKTIVYHSGPSSSPPIGNKRVSFPRLGNSFSISLSQVSLWTIGGVKYVGSDSIVVFLFFHHSIGLYSYWSRWSLISGFRNLRDELNNLGFNISIHSGPLRELQKLWG